MADWIVSNYFEFSVYDQPTAKTQINKQKLLHGMEGEMLSQAQIRVIHPHYPNISRRDIQPECKHLLSGMSLAARIIEGKNPSDRRC